MAPYTDWKIGEWMEIPLKGTKLMCCDCSLVHRFDFRIKHIGNKHVLEMFPIRDERATVNARRTKQKTIVVT